MSQRDALAAHVSRETMVRLDQFVELVEKWNRAINLVAKNSLSDIWTRHVADSAQIATLVRPGDMRWLDIGSGGGFPGIVVAAILHEFRPDIQVVLLESDQRKGVFLRQAISALGLDAEVISLRIENARPQEADVISARALAPLDRLCELAERHLAEGGQCIFLKGGGFAQEIRKAREKWQFQCEEIPSKTSSEAVILRLQELKRV